MKGRLLPLDALRGIAALGVALYHYQHFGGDAQRYPLVDTFPFAWMYARGWCLVDFFFVLSGVVFTHTYRNTIAERAVTARAFFLLRLSRIYPLHLVTLLLCAIMQWRMQWLAQPPLIYAKNDLYHFVLNLFLLQNGTFEEGFSYNGASWSVATEALVYVVFFWLCLRFARSYVIGAVLGLMLGMFTYHAHLSYPFLNETVARTLVGFFAGSLLYLGLEVATVHKRERLLGMGALLALGVIALMASRVGYDAFVGGTGYRTSVPHVLGIFPLVITAALTLPALQRALAIRPLTYLGDISYSVYMLHVPIQMLVLSVARAYRLNLPTDRPGMLLAFVVALLASAALVHKLVEVPARAWLRSLNAVPVLLCLALWGCGQVAPRGENDIAALEHAAPETVRIEPPRYPADAGADADAGSGVAVTQSPPALLSLQVKPVPLSAAPAKAAAPFPIGQMPARARTLRETKRALDPAPNARFDDAHAPYDPQRFNKVVPAIFALHRERTAPLPVGARADIPLRYQGLWLASIQESDERLLLVYGPRYVAVVAGREVEAIVDFAPPSLQLSAQERADMNLAQVLYAEGILYACGEYHGRPTPREGQITAVDVATGRMRWRSQTQVCGGALAVMGDYVFTGYGADVLPYQLKLLRRHDGKLVQSIPNLGAAFDILAEPGAETFIVETYKHRIVYQLQ